MDVDKAQATQLANVGLRLRAAKLDSNKRRAQESQLGHSRVAFLLAALPWLQVRPRALGAMRTVPHRGAGHAWRKLERTRDNLASLFTQATDGTQFLDK